MNKWESLFGRADDRDPVFPIPPAEQSEVPPAPPADEHPITFAIQVNGDFAPYETGLRGAWTSEGGFVVAFASVANAVDCLRLIIRGVERELSSDIRPPKDPA